MEKIKDPNLKETNVILFLLNDGQKEILKLMPNGDIFVHGKLAENDRQVVEGMRYFLESDNRENLLKEFADYWNTNGHSLISEAHIYHFLKEQV